MPFEQRDLTCEECRKENFGVNLSTQGTTWTNRSTRLTIVPSEMPNVLWYFILK